jgi:hypothetical protein
MDKTPIEIDGSSEPYVKLEALAQMLNVRADSIAEWPKKYPDFPYLRLPGVIRVRVSEVRKWLEQFQSKKSEKQ